MGILPGFLLRHTATIEPYLGAGPAGPLYGPQVTVKCFCDDQRRLVRNGDGTEVVSSATVYCDLATTAPAESRVTVNGKTSTVFTTFRRDGRGLPTPDHLEVVLQ